jgi:hypothetical protein
MAFSALRRSIGSTAEALPRWAWAPIYAAIISWVLSLCLLLVPDDAPRALGWSMVVAIAIGMMVILHAFWRLAQAYALVRRPEYFQREMFIHHVMFENYLRVTNKANPEGVRSYYALRTSERTDMAHAFLSYLSTLDRRWWSPAGIRNRIIRSQAFQAIAVVLWLLIPLKLHRLIDNRRAQR